MLRLYGDGIHDDTVAIQQLLDTGKAQVSLPMPEVCYCISDTLKVHSFQEFCLPRYAVIRLLPNSNVRMISNADWENGNENITIRGGIWDFSNVNQARSPLTDPNDKKKIGDWSQGLFHESKMYDTGYLGDCMRFLNVTHFTVTDVTIRNPVTFGIRMSGMNHFTVQNITFDYTTANPKFLCMDGVHINGNCHFGYIRNLQGTCYDDMLAINADDGTAGPISHIDADGIFSHGTHRAVRFQSVVSSVTDISVSNVHGTFYTSCISFTKFYNNPKYDGKSLFDGIFLRNLAMSKCEPPTEEEKPWSHKQPIIGIEPGVRCRNVLIDGLSRRETYLPVPTLQIDSNAMVENITLRNVSVTSDCVAIVNHGTVGKLTVQDSFLNRENILENNGTVETFDRS